ncbi:Flp pilus assembly protein CpaB [Donghicola sp. C2-DW-16]|uniref:Flp pilus assembly protein CpaB n=1 Tax=Donghicola mangrovi TaxID=2729614 RepID=A0A850Q576_9RHOB|nr:Flp pilus assembly protein CpaB [Donghicola mangrovi]NVO24266.1 Flp pilus assembly protein CpaB [Donghicola mangrovi]NVO28395.1 Flp pilus assembly protein CpaB [Donghicola mangrovi]
MRLIFGLVLVVGVALAGFAVFMAKDRIQAYRNEIAARDAALTQIVPTKPVYVLSQAVDYGDKITKDHVRVVNWPESAIPEGSFTTEADLFPAGDDTLRVAIRKMEKDEAVMALKVTEPGKDVGLTSLLDPGMRAFTIKVDVSSGVSGFLRPGDRVDVYWTGAVRTGDIMGIANGDFTKMIEPGVQIIAIDQTTSQSTSEAIIARTVTVSATPEQVATLAQAQSTGDLSLSLLGARDDVVAHSIEVDQNRLLGIETQKVAEVVKEKEVCTIKQRRGAEVIVTEIPCTQ